MFYRLVVGDNHHHYFHGHEAQQTTAHTMQVKAAEVQFLHKKWQLCWNVTVRSAYRLPSDSSIVLCSGERVLQRQIVSRNDSCHQSFTFSLPLRELPDSSSRELSEQLKFRSCARAQSFRSFSDDFVSDGSSMRMTKSVSKAQRFPRRLMSL
jgi:hypothetical protein